MSDTKWRRLFVAAAELGLWACRIKFLGSDEVRTTGIPAGSALDVPRPFVDSAQGPFPLMDIEWLEFPRSIVGWPPRYPGARLTEVRQDVDAAAAHLAELARFPLELTPDGLRVTGHRLK